MRQDSARECAEVRDYAPVGDSEAGRRGLWADQVGEISQFLRGPVQDAGRRQNCSRVGLAGLVVAAGLLGLGAVAALRPQRPSSLQPQKSLRFIDSKASTGAFAENSTCSALWEQCGGMMETGEQWTGPHCCEAGTTCTSTTPLFRQCVQTPLAAEGCEDPVEGDACHSAVTWAMTTGMWTHPEYYAGVTKASEFKEFQELLAWQRVHQDKENGGCKRPCGPGPCTFVLGWEGCETEKEWTCDGDDGSLAYDCCCNKYHKASAQPAGQAAAAAGTVVQGDLGKKDSPSLFCVSLMMPVGYEVGLLRAQLKNGHLGIFGCNEWAVYSNVTMLMTPSGAKHPVYTDVIESDMVVPVGGQYHTALNTDVFVAFWEKVMEDPRSARNDWTVKLDPDALMLPGRLRELLSSGAGGLAGAGPKAGRYLNNCPLGLHGPIEVVSKEALATYKENKPTCVDGAPHQHGQEDWYLRSCMKALGVQKVDAFNVLFEGTWACHERPSSWEQEVLRPPCFSQQVAFHPFKTIEGYLHCYQEASTQTFATAMVPMQDPPSAANHRHG